MNPHNVFLIYILFSLFVKITVQMLLSDPPILINNLRKRQRFIVDKVSNKLKVLYIFMRDISIYC